MVDVFDKNIAIAPPERIEWRPISSLVKPKTSSPINSTIVRNQSLTWVECMELSVPSGFMKVHTFVSSVVPG